MDSPRRGSERRSSVPLLAALWVAFIGLALFIQAAVGCPLAGCRSAGIALVAAVGLAFGLGALLTHSDRLARRQRRLVRR